MHLGKKLLHHSDSVGTARSPVPLLLGWVIPTELSSQARPPAAWVCPWSKVIRGLKQKRRFLQLTILCDCIPSSLIILTAIL